MCKNKICHSFVWNIPQLENKDIYSYGNGIPIAIKNNINVKNWELTCSSNILKGYISPFNATVIEKLESSGLSPFGLTNMDEFAMGSSTESSAHGKTLNPIDNSRIPGGSSGGSAYIEQLENKDIYSYGNGIPIAIKNNINVKN